MIKSLFSISYAGLWGQQRLELYDFVDRAASLGYDAVMIAGKRPHLSPLDATTEYLSALKDHLDQAGIECAVVAGYTDFSGAGPAEVPHHFLKSSCGERTAEDVAYITCGAKLVVLSSFLRVTQDAVSLIYLLEFLISPFLFPQITIGMILHSQFPIGLLDFCVRGVSWYAQNSIIILSHLGLL